MVVVVFIRATPNLGENQQHKNPCNSTKGALRNSLRDFSAEGVLPPVPWRKMFKLAKVAEFGGTPPPLFTELF